MCAKLVIYHTYTGNLISEKDNEESPTDIIYGFFIKLRHKHPLLKIKEKHAFNI